MHHATADGIIHTIKQIQDDDAWPMLGQAGRALSEADKEQMLAVLFHELHTEAYDEEYQTRILDFMHSIHEAKALPYFHAVLQTTSSHLIKVHLCWVLEGRANASFIDVLGQLAHHDQDPLVRLCAMVTLTFIDDPRIIPILEYVAEHDTGLCNGARVSEAAQQMLASVQHLRQNP